MAKVLHGVYCVVNTAFTADQKALDEAAMRRHLRYVLDEGGVHGVVCTGSTGEFPVLSEEERKRVVDLTIDEVAGKVPVVVGAAACGTADTIRHCQYAEKAGAAAVMLVHPFYCPPTEEEIEEHYKAVAASISIPICIYNNIFCSSYDMKPEQLCRLANATENIRFVKETSGDIKRVHDIILQCGDKMTVICGDDCLPFEAFCDGAKGWIAATANVLPQQCVELYNLVVEKKDLDKARAQYYKLLPFVNMLEGEGKFVPYCKAGCELLGRPIGPPRRPALPATPEERTRLKAAIDRALG